MNRIVLIFLLIISSISSFSQDVRPVNVSFSPTINNEIVKINKDIVIDTAENIKIVVSKLKFYISHLSFYKDEKLVWQDKTVAHLMDAENDMNIKLTLYKDIDFNSIKFGLGIDSVTNVSGALDGDLDPLKGMYWTWQSGYVNFKLEGAVPGNERENQKFEYHLGGYSGENNAYQNIELHVEDTDILNVVVDIDKFLSDRYVGANRTIMSPGKTAVQLSKILASCFSAK